MREFVSFQINDVDRFKKNLLNWAGQFSRCCVLDSNQWQGNKNELIAAVGSVHELVPGKNSFEELKKFHALKKDWLFGHLSYDLKNENEDLCSENFDGIGFPEMHFFQPETVFILRDDKLKIGFLPWLLSEQEVENIFKEIIYLNPSFENRKSKIEISARIPKQEYIDTLKKIKGHIHRGDIYEMNYCMEFFSEEANITPSEVFSRLNETSQTPFSAYYRMDEKYLMCASPERFLKKTGNKIISQPIKGTSKRGRNAYIDAQVAALLPLSEKEKSENVMIVDLVRNDLSRTCDNVGVDELFGVYTFKHWHHMISTVSGDLREDVHFTDVIKNSFPMGSMTGAPKVRAMELIEQYEKTKRGLYSGAVGYLSPNPSPAGEGRQPQGWRGEVDFDFNVVIRSILYNASSNYLSFQVGSAITANSIPEMEYEECLLKAKGMFEALNISENLRYPEEKYFLADSAEPRKEKADA